MTLKNGLKPDFMLYNSLFSLVRAENVINFASVILNGVFITRIDAS